MRGKKMVRRGALVVVCCALALVVGTVLATAEAMEGGTPSAERGGAAVQGPMASGATVPYTTLVDMQWPGPQTLDPHWLYDTASLRVVAQVYETLLAYEREEPTTLIPQLATGWDVSADSRIYTFTIRSGVTFHQGGVLEPHDVAYTAQRAMLQGRYDGPQGLSYDAFFGRDLALGSIKEFAAAYMGKASFEELTPEELVQVCQAIKEVAVADDEAGTVTYHLFGPAAWFPALLTQPFMGGIVDQEWMVANGDWDGDCGTWQNWADPAAEESLLYDQMNGTGPFRFDHWIGDEIRLVRYDGYWRSEPAWPEGPSGPAALEAIVFRYIADWGTRRDLLLNGEADVAYVPGTNYSELDPFLWGFYQGADDRDPTLVHPLTGTLRLYKELPSMYQIALLPCYAITTTSPYIGSGALDGNGIPPDFFTDWHVRKAFSYAMDWSRVISDAFGGEAIRSRGPIPKGVLGYSEGQAVYSYNPTLSAQEFQQAWGGQVWSQGFSMTLAYNEGNLTRQRMVEVLAENVEAVNSQFHVKVIGLPSSEYLGGRRTRVLPMYGGGWIEDIHHPHNWVLPFLHSSGYHAQYQSFPPALASLFDAKVGECAALTDQAMAQVCYEELQTLSYNNAAALWGVQGLTRQYERVEVRGFYFNPAITYPYYYALSKGLPPSVAPVSPDVDNTVTFTNTSGATTTLEVPAGAVSETSEIVFTPDVVVEEDRPGGFRLAGLTFDLQICQGGECLGDYVFALPVTLTLDYTDADVAGRIEEELYVYTWDGTTWVEAVTDCGWPPTAYGRYPEENRLVVPLCHFSRFALVGNSHELYLPLVVRGYAP